jgi:hypothetical protein
MASSYPDNFDSFPTITADKLMSDTVGGRAHRGMHNDMADVIEAMQAELGLNPSGQAATVAARLAALDARLSALEGTTQTLIPYGPAFNMDGVAQDEAFQ